MSDSDELERPPAKRSRVDDYDGELDKNVLDIEEQEEEEEEEDGSESLQSVYLATVDRSKLDFDFGKICSVTLANNNVYACLVCGKFYQGRGKNSHAYLHSVDNDHHVFIHLDTLRVYILPDGKEVTSGDVDDVKYCIDPKYTMQEIRLIDREPVEAFDLTKRRYEPGYIGLNNLKNYDYANAVLQAVAHIKPLRDYLLHEHGRTELASATSMLVRKLWSSRAFKPHVSPQQLSELITTKSNKKFTITERKDPFAFLNWFLNQLHVAVGGTPTRPQSSIVHQAMQGRLRKGDKVIPFMFLSLALPKTRLFREEDENSIPQVALIDLFKEQYGPGSGYTVETMPAYLTFHLKRFTSEERNQSVVTFDPQLLEISNLRYRLLANIVIDSTRSDVQYKVQLLHKPTGTYREIQDMHIEKVQPQLLVLRETYIQIWERISS